ncbi:ATP-binding protein [Jutongia huaianensis]|uniref:ATP-binding protein n=1 Tax=Jutongia huaianensis TaxID=2763668 RepID=A0ABR7N0J4_9FIRM|nr:AAA family ATPase [Jutongia huaianensis]MBC8562159.1 ATP-binding protein [Jutongia huaianensis]
MYRKDSITVREWLKNSNKALLVTGARQIGKTWLIRDEIDKSDYTRFEVNFIDQPDMVQYLNTEMSAEEFLVKLKMIMPEQCKPHETVVFFDEIQKCPEIVTKIKFLVEEGSFKYVMSGSLLGVELKGIASAPVGYLTVLRMYPMDFEEFMVANDVSDTTLEMLKEKYETCSPVDEFVHQKLLSLFFVYLIVGGMPDAVKTYIETKDIREVDKVQRDIVTLYREDFTQYELEDKKLKVKSIYDIIPAELNKQNKKFVFTMLNKELKFNRYENSFLWLKDAGVALPVYNVDAPVIPLLAGKSSNVFRLFSSDIGLLTAAYPAETKMELINKNGEVNNGAHFENAVAQQLKANGFELYFCKKKNIGEMDFVIEMNGKVVPIEVKSGKSYKAHKALDHFMKIPDYHLERAYVFSVGNVEKVGSVMYLPVYMCYHLKEKQLGRMIVELDLDGL